MGPGILFVIIHLVMGTGVLYVGYYLKKADEGTDSRIQWMKISIAMTIYLFISMIIMFLSTCLGSGPGPFGVDGTALICMGIWVFSPIPILIIFGIFVFKKSKILNSFFLLLGYGLIFLFYYVMIYMIG